MLSAKAAGAAGREQQVSDLRNALLLAALQRSGKPLTGDDLLDIASGLALDAQWTPETLKLDPKSVAKRLVDMKREGLVEVVGSSRDPVRRCDTPTYAPTGGWDGQAFIPQPQRPGARAIAAKREGKTSSTYEALSERQLRAILDAQDALLESTFRLIQHLHAGLNDMAQTREKARLRLVAEGLEPR